MIDPFETALDLAAMDEFQHKVLKDDTSQVGNDVYLACFNTPAGRAVLRDLFMRYAMVTRAYPGEPEGSAFYREGAAQVTYDIMARVERAAQGVDDNDEG